MFNALRVRNNWLLIAGACGIGLCSLAMAQDNAAARADSSSAAYSGAGVERGKLSLTDLFNLKVVTASKSEESINDAPNVMYVITKEQIKHRGYKNLKDIFQIIPGFGVDLKDIQYVGQVRGIAPNDNEKFALMVNGHIINQVTEPDYFQAGGFPLDNLERIEVIVGPGGVFYGGETLCAILNLITKKVEGNEVVGSVGGLNSYGGGPLPNNDLQAMFGKKQGDSISLFASGSYYARGGFNAWRKNSANDANAALARIDSVTGRVFPSFTMFIGGEFKNWSAQFFSQNSEQPDLHLASVGVLDGRRSDYINSAVIRNKHDYLNGWSSLFELNGDLKRTLRAVRDAGSYQGAATNWDLQQTSVGGEAAVQHTLPDRNFLQLGVQAMLKQHRHNYDFQWNPNNPYAWYSYYNDTINGVVYKDSTHLDNMRAIVIPAQTRSVGMYVSDKFTIFENLKLVGALRLDRDNILDSSVNMAFWDFNKFYLSPRLAVLYSPFEKVCLKAMYNRATRLAQTPQGTPLNHLWGIGEKGLAPKWATENPNISKPEILNTYEVQGIFYLLESTRLTLNYWHQQLQDYTSWFSPRTNVGEFNGDGFEYEIVSEIGPAVSVWTNGALTKNKFTIAANSQKSGSGGEAGTPFQLPANDKGEVMGVPLFNANLGLDLKLFQKLFISPTVRYMTHQVSCAPIVTDTIHRAAPLSDSLVINKQFSYADNIVYVDLALTYEDIPIPFTSHTMDVRGILKNLASNTDLIGTQWMQDSWSPQGLTAELTLFIKF